MVLKNPLVRPYFLGGNVALGWVGPLVNCPMERKSLKLDLKHRNQPVGRIRQPICFWINRRYHLVSPLSTVNNHG